VETLTIFFFPEKFLSQIQTWIRKRSKNPRGTVDCKDNYRDFHVSKIHGRVKTWNSLCQMTMKKRICLRHTTSAEPMVWKQGQNYVSLTLT